MTHPDGWQRIVDLAAGFDEAVAATEAELSSGGIVVIPTDTVYGLAARAIDPGAVEAIFAAKQRPADRRVAVLVADTTQAREVAVVGPDSTRLAQRFWPGPLTMVLPRSSVASSAAGDLVTIGVRCPADRFVAAVCRRVGPLATTSANSHGAAAAITARLAASMLPDVALVIDGGQRDAGVSTVVDLCGHHPVVLREGPISGSEIGAALDRPS